MSMSFPGDPIKRALLPSTAKLTHSCLLHHDGSNSPFSSFPLPSTDHSQPCKTLHAWLCFFNYLIPFFWNFSDPRPPCTVFTKLPMPLSARVACLSLDQIILGQLCSLTVNPIVDFFLGTFSTLFPWLTIIHLFTSPWPFLLAPSQAHFLPLIL